MSEERWAVIPSFPNYEASSEGRVRRRTGGAGARAGRIIAPHRRGRNGVYLGVGLYRGERQENRTVHSVVAEAFLGPVGDLQINHKDGQKTNNRVENLEYVSAKENIAHADAMGLRNVKGTGNANSKLTDEQVRHIRASEESGYALAKKLGVTQSLVNQIRRGEAWRHLL